MTAIPVVHRDVGIGACADLLRPLIEDSDADPIGDEVARLAQENPEIVRAVLWFSEDLAKPEVALAIAAFTVRLLRAQAEVDGLRKMVHDRN